MRWTILLYAVILAMSIAGLSCTQKQAQDKTQATPVAHTSDDRQAPATKSSRYIAGDVQSLIKKLKSSNPTERASAASALGDIGEKASPAIQALIATCDDTAWVDRMDGNFISRTCPMGEAREALVKIGKAVIDPLIIVFKNKEKNVLIRSNVALVFADLKDPSTIKPLIEFLKNKDDKSWDEYSMVTDQTVDALVKITGQNFGDNYLKWRTWYDKTKSK